MAIQIIIGADIVPTESNAQIFAKGTIDQLLDEGLIRVLQQADYRIFNLETPLTDTPTPIKKNGPKLMAPTATIKVLKEINPDFFSLANNHILDQGSKGILSTCKTLEDNGISYAGVGRTLSEAERAHIVKIKEMKIGIYSCAEHEFSIATEQSAGANPFDPYESFDHVRALREACDIFIVLYHGGKEEYRYPSPMMRKTFRKFADVGANLVIAQHTHCIGCQEEYHGSTLVYGQGNFLFDHSESEFWKTALLIQLNIDEVTKEMQVEYLPVEKEEYRVKLSTKNRETILDDFIFRSKEMEQPGNLEKKYHQYAIEKRYGLIQRCDLMSNLLVIKCIKNLIGERFCHFYEKRFFAKMGLRPENTVTCEALSELYREATKRR